MSGVWFAVCIPTEKSERTLRHHDDPKGKIRDSSGGDFNPPAYNDRFSNGGVLSGENEDNKRNETNNKDPRIIAPPEIKKEGLHKTKSKEALEDKILEKRLQEALDLLGITDAVWVPNKDETHYQVYFPCEGPGLRCDFALQTLMSRGIGEKGGSTVGIIPCAVFFNDDGKPHASDEGSDSESDTASVASGPDKKTDKKPVKGFKAMQQEFLKSVTARLTVAQVVESVRTDANLTFDFIMFVVVASMVAALGLMENSAVVIVAAMLISPIMGPILAFTFGAMVRDIPLVLQGIRTEIVGLSICLTSGFLFGFICGNWGDTWGAGIWPTDEMWNRGQERSLWVGALIALPSGAGVALSVLGGNTASLVGVAISASLLPPTVNCGLLWGLGAIKRVRSAYEEEQFFPKLNMTMKPSLVSSRDPHYFVSMDKECAVLGIISFLLTVVNIACIIIAALLILKIKEVAPNTSDSALARFWKQDLKIARDYNRTLGQQEGDQLGKQFLKEWADLNGIDPTVMMSDTAEGKLTQFHTLMDIVEDAQQDDVYLSITRHVPALRRLSQAVPAWNPTSTEDDMGVPRVWDVEYGPPSRSRRSSHAVFTNMQDRMMKRRRSKAPSISINAVAEDDDGHLQPPQVSAIPRKSVVYRRSLVNADNPYSLWPSHNRPGMGGRFDVTPVEDLPQLSNVLGRPRRSRCYSTGIPNPETVTTSF